MDWVLIFDMIIELIELSLENRDRRTVERTLGNPRRCRVALWQVLREKMGLRGKELYAQLDVGMEYYANLGPEGIMALVDEAAGRKG